MKKFLIILIITALAACALAGCGDKSEGESTADFPETEAATTAAETTAPEHESKSGEDGLPPEDTDIGEISDETPPEYAFLKEYFDKMEELLTGWRDGGEFGINNFAVDITLPRIDVVVATEEDADALKEELTAMGDFSDGLPYYNESLVVITLGDDFYSGDLPGGSLLPLDAVPPENMYLEGYFDKIEELLTGWRDGGEFGINRLGLDITLPRIDVVVATEEDAEALKEELTAMGDFSEGLPYYNEDVIRITVGEHFPDDMR